MKISKFINKKTIAIVALALTVTGATVGTTIAYLKDTTEEVVNTFEVGSVETELIEVAAGTTKEPYVLNVGKNDCYVRIRATVSPSTVGNLTKVTNVSKSQDWVLKDGYYYYTKIVSPNTCTATPLFSKLENAIEAGSTFDIVLYQEAVQTTVTKADGYVITDMDKIWEFYDSYNKSSNN